MSAIDADAHVVECEGTFDFIDPEFHDLKPRVMVQQTGDVVGELADLGAVRLHADRVNHGVGAAAVGDAADRLDHVVAVAQVEDLDTALARPLEPLRHQVDPDHLLEGIRRFASERAARLARLVPA